MKVYVLQNKETKKIVAQFDYSSKPARVKYTDCGLPPYIWSEEEFNLHTEEDIAKEKWIELSKFEFKLSNLTTQDRFQKLKEWLEKVNHPKIVDEFTSGIDCAIKRVLDKMQELEKGEKE